jgi:MYXO-CTERM domain-containing protein
VGGGRLIAHDEVVLGADSTLLFGLDSGLESHVWTKNATLGGKLLLDLHKELATGERIQFFRADAFHGTFNGLAEGAIFSTVDRLLFRVSYGKEVPEWLTLTRVHPLLTVTAPATKEGDVGLTTLTVTFELAQPYMLPVTVDYQTKDGTAQAGQDYAAAAGTVTFTPGETKKTVTINVVGDTMVEPDETFEIALTNVTNATLATGSVTTTITNDDVAPPMMMPPPDMPPPAMMPPPDMPPPAMMPPPDMPPPAMMMPPPGMPPAAMPPPATPDAAAPDAGEGLDVFPASMDSGAAPGGADGGVATVDAGATATRDAALMAGADAAVLSADAGGALDGGAADAATDADGSADARDGGCGCRIGGSSPPASPALLLALGAALAWRRRRRR